ncbi:MAG TPA: sugar transferase [Blastocatellia bacterium]|jgi:lipopolysaccharide/colanic/teichoic acid biosynthesis glycosyltransferase
MSAIESAIKRVVDVGASLFAIIILSPLFLVVALLIKLDSKGPALFCQRRLGKDARVFGCYKFRTMFVGAPDLRNSDGSTFNSHDDPRVTRIGRLLRRASLDELPQFFNVLSGKMSLVGPRPDQEDQIRYYTVVERLRLTVKPGLTGLAQINGRNSISWERRKQLDLEYVRSQSLWLDFVILLQSLPYVLIRRDVFVTQSSNEADTRIPG